MHGLSALTWLVGAALALAAFALARAEGFGFEVGPRMAAIASVLAIAPLGFAFYFSLRRPLRHLAPPFLCFAQFGVVNMAAWFASYVAASLDWPLVDAQLARIDASLGTNWGNEFLFAFRHPLLFNTLVFAYKALLWQVLPACMIVGLFDPRRLRIFAAANAIGISVTVVFATLTPAVSAYGYFHPPLMASWVDQVIGLRDGTIRILRPETMSGIITFPSYHTVLAILIAYAFSGFRRFFPIVIAFEIALLIATRVVGGHYLIDIVAGAAIAFAAIAIAERVERGSPREIHQPVAVKSAA